ncbi:nuclear pore component-domain-containing protein [Linnemannia elongata]|nr:nuclear pore component-domain-containing protein [Linnemannia elongata]
MDSPPNTARPTWLNQLPDHSIFELNEQEYLEWSQQAAAAAAHEKDANKATTTTTTNNDPINQGSLASRFSFGASTTNATPSPSAWPKPEPVKDSYGLEDLSEEYQGAYQGLSCMAVRGQDLYVAVGRQIRYASLEELKMGVEYRGREAAIEYIDKRQHKVLKVQDVDFDIRRLVLNQDGKLLAIVGDEKIVIAATPSKSSKQDSKPVIKCKSFVLGEFYHINKGESKVVKVLWHPLSKGFTHLVVLTHDGLLRMYDVAADIDEPEQIYSFRDEGVTSRAYGMDVLQAASFCFGSKYSPWGQLAVYGLTREGDLYMVCPVMPQTCTLNATDLDEIRKQIEESASQESPETALVKKNWINKVVESIQPHPFSEEMVLVQNPSLKSGKVSRQGPFLYKPAPIDLDDDDNRAYDILCLENEVAEVIAMAHSSGKVDICIALDRPTGRWSLPSKPKTRGTYGLDDDDDDDEERLPEVSVYESVDLGLLKVFATSSASSGGAYGLTETRMGIVNRPVLVADTMYGDTFYIYHEAGAHCISIRPWLDELTAIYESGSSNQQHIALMNKFFASKIKSAVGSVVNTRPTKASPPAPIIGLSIVTDAYLDYSLLLLTSSLQLIGMELTPRPRKSAASGATPSPATFPGSLTTPKDDDGSRYTVSLSEPMFDKQGGLMALNGLPLQPQVILPPGVGSAKIVVTEENLKFLGQMVQGVRESLREVFTACDLAQLRLVAQEKEYTRQQDVVQKTYEHITGTLGAKVQKQVDRLDAQIALQSALMARADGLLQKVMESREPALSPAEKEWMADVKTMDKVVKALDARRHQVGTQYEVLKRRLAEMKRQIASGQSITEDPNKRVSYSLLDRSGSPDFTKSWSPRRASTVVAKRQPVKRYGDAQIKPIESALTDQSGMLDTTTKMVKELETRMGSLDITHKPVH